MRAIYGGFMPALYQREVPKITPDRPVLYLSGPMTGYPDSNYPAFQEASKRLRADGWLVVDPSEHFGGQRDLPRHKYLARDVTALLTRCDAIALLPDWEESEGAKLEAQLAFDQGYKFFEWCTVCGLQPADMPEVIEALS